MEKENIDKNLTDTQTAEAERNLGGDLGKFKNVDALLNAYNNLEAEFTRRSQRLKELEENAKNLTEFKTEGVADASKPLANDANLSVGVAKEVDEQAIERSLRKLFSSGEIKDKIIEEYLKGVSTQKSAPLLDGGEIISAPVSRPKTIEQAGKLAFNLIQKKTF